MPNIQNTLRATLQSLANHGLSYERLRRKEKGLKLLIEGVVHDFTKSVYGESYTLYAVCTNCGHIRKQHTNDKCLFEPTTFVAKKGEAHADQ